jgi:hypothetical protein
MSYTHTLLYSCIHTQISAAHTLKDLKLAVQAFRDVRQELGIWR